MGVITFAFVLTAIYFVWAHLNKPRRSLPLPPGPKPLPLVGNITNLTSRELWLRTKDWARQYGDMTYLHVFGQGLLFLNNYEGAVELLEKRGAIYSDKPGLVMAGDLCGCENMVAFTRYGDKSRRQRRLMNMALGVNSVKQYSPLLESDAHDLLKRLLQNPADYVDNLKRYAGGLTLSAIYGYQVRSNEDEMLRLADECVNILSNDIASGGGIWPVDIFPALQSLPDWAPGAGFKRKAAVWKSKMEEFVEKPYAYVKERMRDGTALPCFCTTLLEELQERSREEKKEAEQIDPQRDFDIRWTANSMYSASIDTTMTVVSHFILAMILHPEVLARVQEEIDTVVGSGRLPTFSDRASLPYLESVMSETLRWGVPVPLALPHRLMEDDTYNGYHIPKGTLVFGNVWNMVRNPELYPDPEAFHPERFLVPADELTAKRRDPRNYVFGFGRRRCPGLHLIEQSLWIVMACMVATLDISKAIDDNGDVIEPKISFDNSVFRTPSPFKCDLRPRSEQSLKIIRQVTEGSV
ncbi:hypothetical protein FOMPIDRAFT_1112479 [Fomitopsis schrenkii]|uniref:Cytochrome P450 n=1 Tax=Fomitopsis schrenkii TaxID=2126942 RepID=S8EKV0_FOMSC|nr:hypothetical protein FOMPIDRAFT_1112479 [Fomitopsis schrenkii]